MKRGIPMTAAGTQLAYAVETVKGTMPTTANLIPDIKSVPNLNPQPEQHETTDLSCTKTKTYTAGLQDLSNAGTYTANLTTLLISEWKKLCATYETAKSDGKALWVFIKTPNLPTVAFTAAVTPLGSNAREVNSVMEIDCFITPTGEPTWIDDEITVTEPTG